MRFVKTNKHERCHDTDFLLVTGRGIVCLDIGLDIAEERGQEDVGLSDVGQWWTMW